MGDPAEIGVLFAGVSVGLLIASLLWPYIQRVVIKRLSNQAVEDLENELASSRVYIKFKEQAVGISGKLMQPLIVDGDVFIESEDDTLIVKLAGEIEATGSFILDPNSKMELLERGGGYRIVPNESGL